MRFYVYTHARPDGSIFYVGKGSGRRAWDFSPSRRRKHHRNIALKHGLRNIIVWVVPCEDEPSAFALERRLIGNLTSAGVRLINQTEGGEGTAGRKPGERTLATFRKWHGAFHRLEPTAQQAILDGLARGRANSQAWRDGPAGQAHVRSLGQRSAAATAARPLIELICQRCGDPTFSKSPRTKYCKPCSKNGARDAKPKPPRKPLGPQSPEARARIGAAQRAKWDRMTEDERSAWKARIRERGPNPESGISQQTRPAAGGGRPV